MNTLGGLGDASVDDLKAKGPSFMQRLNTMHDDAARTGNQDAIDLASYGDTLKSVIEGFTGAMDTAGNIMSSIQYGITHPFGYSIPGLSGYVANKSGLGILPVLAAGELVTLTSIAGAAAAATAISYYITKADRVHADIMAGEWEIAQKKASDLAAQGDQAGAQAVIDEFNRVQVATQPTSIGSTISSVTSLLLVGGLIFLFLKGRK